MQLMDARVSNVQALLYAVDDKGWPFDRVSERLSLDHVCLSPGNCQGAGRPSPGQRSAWVEKAGFQLLIPFVALPPYHYGLVGRKVREHDMT